MRTTFAYYLLLIYVVAACKPALPVVKDFIAHTFWNGTHTATVHQHSGDSHVHYELAQAAKGNEGDSGASLSRITDPVSAHILYEYEQATESIIRERSPFFPMKVFFISAYNSVDVPPPRC